MLKGKTLKCYKSFGSLQRAGLAKRDNTPVFCVFPLLLEGRDAWKGSCSLGPTWLRNQVLSGPPSGASASPAPSFEAAWFSLQ